MRHPIEKKSGQTNIRDLKHFNTYNNDDELEQENSDNDEMGYNAAEDDIEMLDDQYNFNTFDSIPLEPYSIVCSGLDNMKFVDNAMFYLHLMGIFNEKSQYEYQKRFNTLNCNDKKVQ
ncbi:7100_t:CDS:2, partial [Cetraspora pellucida]